MIEFEITSTCDGKETTETIRGETKDEAFLKYGKMVVSVSYINNHHYKINNFDLAKEFSDWYRNMGNYANCGNRMD